jgi:hypothetical protein
MMPDDLDHVLFELVEGLFLSGVGLDPLCSHVGGHYPRELPDHERRVRSTAAPPTFAFWTRPQPLEPSISMRLGARSMAAPSTVTSSTPSSKRAWTLLSSVPSGSVMLRRNEP